MKIRFSSESSFYSDNELNENLHTKRIFEEGTNSSSFHFVFFEDISEQSDHYSHFSRQLILKMKESGISVDCFIIDSIGQGKSSGSRGHIESLIAQTKSYLNFLNAKFKEDDDVVLFGNGVGSLSIIQILDTFRNDVCFNIKNSILLNPAFSLKFALPKVLSRGVVSEIRTIGRLRLPFRIDESLTGSKINISADPLSCHYLTYKAFSELVNNGRELRSSSHYIKANLALLISGKDALYEPEASISFAQVCSEASLTTYDEACHDLINNENTQKVVQDIVNLINTNMKSGALDA